MFSADDTLAFIYDKVNVNDTNILKRISNPYFIASSNNRLTRLKIDKYPSYIVRVQRHSTLRQTLLFLTSSNFFSYRHYFNSWYLIIMNDYSDLQIDKVFLLFWNSRMFNVALLTSSDNKNNKTLGTIYTSNPFYKENICGMYCRNIRSQECNTKSSIIFETLYKDFNQCTIAMSVGNKYGSVSPVATIGMNILSEISKKVNAKFIVNYGTNDSIDEKASVRLQIITQQYETYEFYDLSDILLWDNLVFVMRGGDLISPITALFVIFKIEVWIIIVASILITSLVLWMLSPKKDVSEYSKISLNVFSATIWGNFSSISQRTEIRCICIGYLIYHIHIQTGFTCNLTTILTTPRYESGISNIEQLTDSKISIYTLDFVKNMYFSDIAKSECIYTKIKSQMHYVYHLNHSLLANHQSVLISELSAKMNSYFLNNTVRLNTISANTITGSSKSIFCLHFGKFFMNTLNHFIGIMKDSGIAEEIKKKTYEYENESLDLCISIVINRMFSADDTLAFIYDNIDDTDILKRISNPYLIAGSNGLTRLKIDTYPSYIIRIENHSTLLQTMLFLTSSSFFTYKDYFNSWYLLIMNDNSDLQIDKVFQLFWNSRIFNVALLTSTDNEKNKTLGTIYTSNPFYKENFCGVYCRNIRSQECNSQTSIIFETLYKDFNQCSIAMLVGNKYGPISPVAIIGINILSEISKKVNAKFIVYYGTNDNTDEKVSVCLQIITQQYESYEFYDLSDILLWDNLVFVMRGGDLISPITALFVIFKMEVWVMILASILITSLVLWMISSRRPKKNFSEYSKILLNVFSATLWGNFLSISQRTEIRCICICYLIYHIHIQTGFTSNLTTILTTPRYESGISNIEQLADSKISIYTLDFVKDMYFSDIAKSECIYTKIKSQMRYVYKLNNSLLVNHQSLLISELSAKMNSYFLNNTVRLNTISANTITGSSKSIFCLHFGKFFMNTLNHFIGIMKESGIAQEVKKKTYGRYTLPNYDQLITPLTLHHLMSAFILWIIGILISVVVFMIEFK
ncbi:hypothetical protein FQR65_LT08113 [Abscondita terminalis]|nr:hypothetical protein FQR65_LT08113 [Abscondita terminalis]